MKDQLEKIFDDGFDGNVFSDSAMWKIVLNIVINVILFFIIISLIYDIYNGELNTNLYYILYSLVAIEILSVFLLLLFQKKLQAFNESQFIKVFNTTLLCPLLILFTVFSPIFLADKTLVYMDKAKQGFDKIGIKVYKKLENKNE